MRGRIKTTPVYEWNYRSDARIKINQGGTSSGKTYNILLVIFMRLILSRQIAIVIGRDIPHLKKGALRDFTERILYDNPWMNAYIASYNKTERVFRFKNGSIMEFTSFKDPQSARGGRYDIAYFNEANGMSYELYFQIAARTKREIFIDYNPSEEFWVHDHLMADPKAVTFYSNFTHNPYCPDVVKDYLFSLKHKDAELWKVYGLGKTGIIQELIYRNWKIVPEMPKNLKKRHYGMDFGYGTSPTALVECGIQNERDLYVSEMMYGWKFMLDKIDDTMNDLKLRKTRKVYADGANPLFIRELRKRGHKLTAATKGAGSVNYGIEILQNFTWHITEDSYNLINEIKRYKRKVDKDGKVLDEPAKAFDHLMDATRYYALMNLKKLNTRPQVKHRK